MTTTQVHAGGGFSGAVASEWTKLWSVRATWWCLSSGVVLILGFSVILGVTQRISDDRPVGAHGVAATGAFYLAQFAVVALATLFITSEYASGGIRSTLQWVPVRSRVLAAKSAVLAPVLFGYGVVLALAAMALASVVMGPHGLPTSLGAGMTTVLGMGAYFALLGLLCLGIGTALRSAAGAMVTVFVLLLMLPLVLAGFAGPDVPNYFPGIAGLNGMIETGARNPVFDGVAPYASWVGTAICAGWAAAALVIGGVVFKRRDA
ncbi:ABC transporter permease subunit [Amycolatopsis sp. NPDC059021]|uniref:ABC transporter permease subunit n=1 Tax=Amycolatopsis sp. NPDC059021 TaxID=3346704 RepID=UPI0036712B98